MTAEVLVIPSFQYENVVKKVHLSTGEKKVEFLFRYVPKIRKGGRAMIEDYEILFIKEIVSKGFLIQKQDE